jgi:hypothetical protein
MRPWSLAGCTRAPTADPGLHAGVFRFRTCETVHPPFCEWRQTNPRFERTKGGSAAGGLTILNNLSPNIGSDNHDRASDPMTVTGNNHRDQL